MRADHNARTRETIINEFNNSENSDKILVLTLK